MPPIDNLTQTQLQQAHVDIAVLQTQVAALTEDVAELKAAITALTSTITTMNTTLAEARGGWKFMMMLGGAGATFGAGLMWLVQAVAQKGH